MAKASVPAKVEDSPSTAVALTDEEKFLAAPLDLSEDAGVGLEGIGREDIKIPFIYILQPMSPTIVDGNRPEAKPGMMLNMDTGDLFDCEIPSASSPAGDKGLIIIRCHAKKEWVEWRPMSEGGGIVQRYLPEDPVVLKSRAEWAVRIKTDDKARHMVGKNELVETHYITGLILDEDLVTVKGIAIVPAKSSHIAGIKAWNTSVSTMKGANRTKPAIYGTMARLCTVKEKNERGTWYRLVPKPFSGTNWNSGLLTNAQADVARAARELYELANSGMLKISDEQEMQDVSKAEASGGSGGARGKSEEPLPF